MRAGASENRAGRLLAGVMLAWALVGCAGSNTMSGDPKTAAQSPDRAWGPVMVAIAEAGLYDDQKTVVDLIPRREPSSIVADYQARTTDGPLSREALKAFVRANFDEPPENEARLSEEAGTPIDQHIKNLWPYLTRDPAATDEGQWSSLVVLPHRYVVPGGRFNEMFYWDSFFTMLGLAHSDRYDLVRDMVDNFAWLIDQYGFIPNGTRTYFLTRSQPPFFASMVGLLAEHDGDEVYQRYLPELEQEYDYWMQGAETLSPGQAQAHVVKLEDGTLLNRYHGSENMPRPESWASEVALAQKAADRPAPEVYANLRAAAESGWDFSSRWMRDGSQQTTVATRDVLPVDLNALLFHLEQTLAHAWQLEGNQARARQFEQRAETRREAINRVFWDADRGLYTDYDWRDQRPSEVVSAAMVYPLTFGVADQPRAEATAAAVERELLRPGGMVTTNRHTGEQWDAPNGWAPLQWLAVEGLSRYGQTRLAATIARRWIDTNQRVYDQTGKLVEKYNVENPGVGGGGEYEVVDGFGWTNGVLLDLIARYPQAVSTP
ncbi:alpha,alpha-trehalase [Kushneria avicenniae]|uniref:Alpha,alpha-trehalase n=1 Tax=Kushneria avicenniae TaxID=402385 RepID=A0A1I1JH97_9GAMM|nr:alpha,alpha-trehalase TreA [Kushneria avicenniae]SFC45323.1 alpha,alpha-trehalase [Kushneria avicenniae]